MDGMNLLTLVLAGVLKRKTRDTSRSFLRNDLQTLHHSWHDLVFNARIKSFGVFADHDQVNSRIACGNVRQITNRPKVSEQLEPPAQLNVNAGKATADRRCHRTLQANTCPLDRFAELFRDVFFVFFESFGARGEAFPFEFNARSFEYTNRSLDDLRADSIARNKSYFVCHRFPEG